ncbi:MAG: arylsulfotransferase family protein [Myxococcota bacterium]
MPRAGIYTATAVLVTALATASCGSETGEVATPPLPDETAEQLEALGYVDWSEPAPQEELARSGVTVHDPQRAHAGLNLYTSIPSHEARLVDMQGRVVHTWRDPRPGESPWHHVELTPEGHLYGLSDEPLRKVDWDSNLLWESGLVAHHDLQIEPSGRLWVLAKSITRLGPERTPIVDNEIVEMRPDGGILARHKLSELFSSYPSPAQLARAAKQVAALPAAERVDAKLRNLSGPIDVFHANSIERLDRDVPGLGEAGDVLLSIRQLDRVFVFDLELGRMRRAWGHGVLDRPHHATVLPDGTLSVFDNGWRRGWSRALRVDPAGWRVVWQYPAAPDPAFFTRRRGSAQHLPNGNVLITESAKGRVVEVDAVGRVVWEFWNPDLDAEGERRARIYRMERIDPATLMPLAPIAGEADGA